MNGPRGALLTIASAAALLASVPAHAAPTDFPISIRSIDPGSAADPTEEYVMAQMTVDGQQDLAGLSLSLYGPDGNLTRSFSAPSGVAHGDAQRTVLFANLQAVGPGFPTPDFDLGPADNLDPAGGAVCIGGPHPADCASWGSFPLTLARSLPDPQAFDAEAIAGAALARPLVAGCPGTLGPEDDRNDSSLDFFDGVPPPQRATEPAPPMPVSNSAPPAPSCVLETQFNLTPANPTSDTTPTFAFGEVAAEYGATFRCSFEGAPFAPCSPTGTGYGPLADGAYRFEVEANGAAGPDPTPATWIWQVDTVAPETEIDSGPAEPSSGFAARFGFHSSEDHASFACRLDDRPRQDCEPGKTFFLLPDGTHVFRVWSSDQAANADPTPAVRSFSVDTRIGDRSPPNTRISSAPPAASPSSRPAFTYVSSEPGSSFQCSLDDLPMVSCPATGVAYGPKKNGRHRFRVRAIDRAGNVDDVPASYAWEIRAALPQTLLTRVPPGVSYLKGDGRRLRFAFAFRAGEPGSAFRCRLDKQRFRRCASPHRVVAGAGRHLFEVAAVDGTGNRDPSPARWIFRIFEGQE